MIESKRTGPRRLSGYGSRRAALSVRSFSGFRDFEADSRALPRAPRSPRSPALAPVTRGRRDRRGGGAHLDRLGGHCEGLQSRAELSSQQPRHLRLLVRRRLQGPVRCGDPRAAPSHDAQPRGPSSSPPFSSASRLGPPAQPQLLWRRARLRSEPERSWLPHRSGSSLCLGEAAGSQSRAAGAISCRCRAEFVLISCRCRAEFVLIS